MVLADPVDPCRGAAPDDAAWRAILDLFALARLLRDGAAASLRAAFFAQVEHLSRTAGPLANTVYLPLVMATADGPVTIGQVGQSLDGRVSAGTGERTRINSDAGLDHLHRLRALVDAVVVGATTVITDDPLLTTRRVSGESPVRIVIDPRRRLAGHHRIFAGPPATLIAHHAAEGHGVTLSSSADDGSANDASRPQQPLALRLVLAALRRRGLKSVLVEGGPATLSCFLNAGLLDRLHIIVAPVILGTGVASFSLPSVTGLDDAFMMATTVHRLDDDLLIDCVPQRRGQPASPDQAANTSR